MKKSLNNWLSTCVSALLTLAPAVVSAQTRELLWKVDQQVALPGRVAFFGADNASPIDFRPSFQLNRVVASDSASYLAIPINVADLTASNAFTVVPPSWQGTLGWQVVKLDANGSFVWKRQIASGSATVNDFKLTAEGGVALLQNRQLSVFGPSGEVRFTADTVTELCLDPSGNPNGVPHRVFLTDADVLVVAYAGSNNESARACAYNLQGTLLDSISSVFRIEVGDFRQNVGFLIKEGDFLNSIWSNTRFELRNRNQTLWSLNVADEAEIPRTTQIAPDGSTWLRLANRFQRLLSNGTVAWDIPALGYQNVGFLSGNRGLLSNPSATQIVALNSNGSLVWSVEQPAWSDLAHPPVWQIGAVTTRVVGFTSADRKATIRNIASGSGTETNLIVASLPTSRAIFGFGSLAGSGGVSIDSGATPSVNPPPSGIFCPSGGFCPESARFGVPSLRLYRTDSSLISDSLLPALTSALPTRPLERQSAVKLVGSGGTSQSVMHVGYSHDGYRQVLVAQHLSANGELLWQRILNTARYDAENASFNVSGNSVFISASESAPAAAFGQLWELRLSDGVVLNNYSTPTLQALEVLGSNVCSFTAESTTRVLCVQAGQVPVVRSIIGGPAGALNLLAYGIDGAQLRGRVVNGINSQFKFVRVNADGTYAEGVTLAFQSNPGAFPLRADRVQSLANAETLASARLNDSSNGNAIFASVVALFAADGSRIWQTEINEPQRDYQPSTQSALNTVLTRASNGDIYVGLQARPIGPSSAPVRICRLNAAGQLLECRTAPRAGRVVALIPDPDGQGVLVWLRGHAGNTSASSLSTQIFSLTADGFSALQFNLPNSVVLAADSFTLDGDSVYAVLGTLNNFGVAIDRADSTLSVVKIALGSDAIFRNGFED